MANLGVVFAWQFVLAAGAMVAWSFIARSLKDQCTQTITACGVLLMNAVSYSLEMAGNQSETSLNAVIAVCTIAGILLFGDSLVAYLYGHPKFTIGRTQDYLPIFARNRSRHRHVLVREKGYLRDAGVNFTNDNIIRKTQFAIYLDPSCRSRADVLHTYRDCDFSIEGGRDYKIAARHPYIWALPCLKSPPCCLRCSGGGPPNGSCDNRIKQGNATVGNSNDASGL